MSGCVKAIIILLVLGVVALIAFVVFAGALFNNLRNNLGIDIDGGGGGISDNCAFLSDADAKSVFGGSADAFDLSGLADASIGLIIDKRVLANAPDCWITEGDKAYIARIALSEGGDSSALFAAERKAAEPTSEDQGGGVTLESEGYFGGDVSGLGDEAFCTGISTAIMAGVLVRQGDRVVYVSVGPADETKPPEMDVTGDGTVTAPALCTFAQEVARFMLR
jgi:hypothetical protein